MLNVLDLIELSPLMEVGGSGILYGVFLYSVLYILGISVAYMKSLLH